MKRGFVAALLVAGALVSWPRDVAHGQSSSDAVFDDTTLHRVDLWVNTRDWSFLKANFQLNRYYPANFKWRGQTMRNVAIRSRGLGSRSGTKPGLLVDFDRFTTGQRFQGLKALVLDNLTQDASFLHELMTMKLFRRLGLQAPRESLAEVYVNNEYLGVYTIVEEMDELAVERMFGDGGGYLHEFKWLYEYRFEDLGDDLARYAELFEPRTHELQPASTLFEPIVAMVRAFNDTPDEEFEEKAGQVMDLTRFVSHAAVQAYVAEWDGLLGYAGLNNFYLYRLAASSRFSTIPWDEDNAFGPLDYPVDANHQGNVLMRRLMEREPWREAYYSEVLAAAASAEEGSEADPEAPGAAAGGWMEREIVRLQDLIRERALADRNKPFTTEEVQQASAAMLVFARERGRFVRSEVARLRSGRR
jgi:spore coat protein CotH